jgi:UDP-N-acetylglucosamine 2-epimerase (non-hydrolysing)
VTGHRRENFGEGFREICNALKKVATAHPDIKIVYPVHMNPEVKQVVLHELSNRDNILLCSPLSYPDFVYLMKIAWIILTDSGGIQEEGPALGKPVLVMRQVTERPEAIHAGTVKLVGTHCDDIVSHIQELIQNPAAYEQMKKAVNPYGDGAATDRIVQWITSRIEEIKNINR